MGQQTNGTFEPGDEDPQHASAETREFLDAVTQIPQTGIAAAVERTGRLADFGGSVSESLHMLERQHRVTLMANAHSQSEFVQLCHRAMNMLEPLLQPQMPFEERKYVIEQVMTLVQWVGDKDTENKTALSSWYVKASAATVALTGAGALIWHHRDAIGKAVSSLRRS